MEGKKWDEAVIHKHDHGMRVSDNPAIRTDDGETGGRSGRRNIVTDTGCRIQHRNFAKTVTQAVRPGTRLIREWNGVAHIVEVGEDGALRWNGAVWNSLSEVARAITGTRWSGPAFFGLKSRKGSQDSGTLADTRKAAA